MGRHLHVRLIFFFFMNTLSLDLSLHTSQVHCKIAESKTVPKYWFMFVYSVVVKVTRKKTKRIKEK